MNKLTDLSQLEEKLKDLREDAVPSDAFRSNSRIRILNTVTNPHPLRMSWYQRPRVLGYTFGTAIATVMLSVGTVYAAQSSLPNSTLYPVKVLSERVALTLSPTDSIKTTIAATIISRRIDEIQQIQKQGDQKVIDESIANYDEDVASIHNRKGVSQSAIDSTISEHATFINSLRKNHKDDKRGDESHQSEDNKPETPAVSPAVTVIETPKTEGTPAPTSTQTEIRLPSIEGVTTNHEDN